MNGKKIQPRVWLLLGVFAAAALLALPLRTYQFFSIIEGSTGFYGRIDFSVYALYILLAACCAAIFVAAFAGRKSFAYSGSGSKNIPLACLSFFLAAGFIADAVTSAMGYQGLGNAVETGLLADPYTAGSVTASGTAPLLFEAVFALASAAFAVVLGLDFINGAGKAARQRLLAIMPLAWCMSRILYRFMRKISFVNVSDLLFELFMLVFLMLFFMAFAQTVTAIGEKGVEWKLYAFGLPGALLCLVCFVPRCITVILGRSDLLGAQSPPEFCDLAVAAFIIGFITTRVGFTARQES